MEMLKPYDDYKIEQKKAEAFIEHILGAACYFEHSIKIRPTVFMSCDILAIISKGMNNAIISHKYREPMKICGYDLELVDGEHKLYLGYQLSEPRW